MADKKTLKLGEILLEWGVVTSDQITQVLTIQKTSQKKFGEILIDKGFATDQQVTQALAEICALPFVNLTEMDISSEVYSAVPAAILKKYNMIPTKLENNYLTVATNDPLNVSALQEIQYSCGHQIQLVLASSKDIKDRLNTVLGVATVSRTGGKGEDGEDVGAIAQIVEQILGNAIKERASDLHFEPLKEKMRVRFRIDGVLYEKTNLPKEISAKLISRVKIMAGMDVADRRRPQDGRMSLEKFQDFDIRVSTIPNANGENMVLRVLNKSVTKFTFDVLGMEKSEETMIKNIAHQPYGMILITGPTGSGKSTTLYAILNHLNETTRNIITVEDPIEYRLEGINQTCINTHVGYTFPTALRAMLRHDPDVIMVGEIRDSETAEIAIRAALTGHLVISTLHTNTSAGAIMRLLEMNIEPFLIRSAMIGIVAQRLVRRLCTHCKKEYTVDEKGIGVFKEYVGDEKSITLAAGVGCAKCYNTGYAGRVGLYEILTINDAIRDMVLANPNEKKITDLAVSQGMKTLRRAGIEKAVQKLTSIEEIIRTIFTGQD